MPALRLLISVVAAVGAVACDATSPDNLRVIAKLEKSSLSLSESSGVTLQVANLGLRTVRGTHPGNYGMCNHAYRVFKDQREVSLPSNLCILANLSNSVWFNPIVLGPGARVTINDSWAPGSSTLDGAAIGPGTYTIVGVYHAEGVERRSAPVNVTVTQ